MNDETKEAIALFRFGVLGPLVSARLEHGDGAPTSKPLQHVVT